MGGLRGVSETGPLNFQKPTASGQCRSAGAIPQHESFGSFGILSNVTQKQIWMALQNRESRL